MKEIICDEDYFVMYPLFNFELVKGFKCRSNVRMFSVAGDSADICIFNLLKVFNLFERQSVVKKVIIVTTRVEEGNGCSDSGSNARV